MTRLLSILLLFAAMSCGAQVVPPAELQSIVFTESMTIRLDWNNPTNDVKADSTLVTCGGQRLIMPLTNSCALSLDASKTSLLPIIVLNFITESQPVSTNFGVTNYNIYGVPSQPLMLLVGFGASGSNYTVYASSDLATWENVYSVIGANEPWMFTEPTQPQRFYKIIVN